MFDVVIDHFESLSRKFPDRFAGRRFQMYNICFERLSHFNSEICQALVWFGHSSTCSLYDNGHATARLDFFVERFLRSKEVMR